MPKRLTTEEFIERANTTHHYKYDYSNVSYKNMKTKVGIICPEHGIFYQTPEHHINRKQGCPKCNPSNKMNTESFIRKSKMVHGDTYLYDNSVYKGNSALVRVTCKIHGDFWQTADNHLRGHGCPLCAKEKSSIYKERYKDNFIQKSNEVHNFKYDYSNVEYVDAKKRVLIICPIHGEFWQKPYHHMNGSGCPKCGVSISSGEEIIKKYLKEKEIKFEYQKSFKGCFNKKLLKFDFYLPDYNLCIEYQGQQHYFSISIFGGEKGLLENQKRDDIKKIWCSNPDNPDLLEIRYDEDINTILDNYFLNNFSKESRYHYYER